MTIWYVARGAGLAALVLLTAATCLGIVLAKRGSTLRSDTKVVAQYVHRFVATLGLAVLGLHVTAILADSFAHVSPSGAAVPFTAGYRTFWVGLGSIATYAVLLTAMTGFLRRRFAASPHAAAWWRALHGTAYAGWALAMLHGLRAGSDTGLPWVRWIYLGCAAAFVGCVAVRTLTAPADAPPSARAGRTRSAVTR